jgi:hypothetical protein
MLEMSSFLMVYCFSQQ